MALSTLQHHVKRGNVRLIDGKVDVEVARIQLARHTDPEQSMRGQMSGAVASGSMLGAAGGTAPAAGAGAGSSGAAGGDGRAAGDGEGKGGGRGLWEAKETSERLRAQLLELELAEKHGKLVDAGAVHKATMARARIARDALMAIPSRIGAQLAAETDSAKVQDILAAEIRAVCAQIAGGDAAGGNGTAAGAGAAGATGAAAGGLVEGGAASGSSQRPH